MRTGSAASPRQPAGGGNAAAGSTRVEVRYSRRSARGRELFGAVVPWGRPWTPGADTATSITFTEAVRINGPIGSGLHRAVAMGRDPMGRPAAPQVLCFGVVRRRAE